MSPLRKVLLSLMVVSAVGSTVSAGTFASFAASTSNDTSTVATGSLVLTDTKDAGTDGVVTGTVCFSSGGALADTDDNDNGACDQLINVEVQKPGDTAYADLTLQNMGNLGGQLKVKASQACTTTNASGQNYSGGGDACAGTRMYLQQYPTILARSNDDTAAGACWYGAGEGGTTCSFDSSHRLDTFASSHPSDDSSPALDMGVLAGGANRYLRIRLELPADAANTLQGVQANFGFTWTLEQTA